MLTQFQLGSYIHGITNKTHSLTILQDLIPTLAGNYRLHKLGLNLVGLLENVFHLCIHRFNYPAEIVFA